MSEYVEVMESLDRMCGTFTCNGFSGCDECPISSGNNGEVIPCATYQMRFPKNAEQKIMAWDKKNPVCTILDEFKENYPDAPLNKYGVPSDFCPPELGYKTNCFDYPDDEERCLKCWSRPSKSNK